MFDPIAPNPRNMVKKSAAYVLLTTDEYVEYTGAAAALTLPDLKAGMGVKTALRYHIKNQGTGNATLTPATGQTVNGAASLALIPGAEIVIQGSRGGDNWFIDYPLRDVIKQANITGQQMQCIIANSNGTTPVNVFGAAGLPMDLNIIDMVVFALDTTAGNILLKLRTDTVSTTAKGTTTGLAAPTGSLSTNSGKKGEVCTIESSSAGNVRALIFYATT